MQLFQKVTLQYHDTFSTEKEILAPISSLSIYVPMTALIFSCSYAIKLS